MTEDQEEVVMCCGKVHRANNGMSQRVCVDVCLTRKCRSHLTVRTGMSAVWTVIQKGG